jgi:hypothetical protein
MADKRVFISARTMPNSEPGLSARRRKLMRTTYSFVYNSARSDVGPNQSSDDSPTNQRLAKLINAVSPACMHSSRPYSMSVYLPPSSDDFQLKRPRCLESSRLSDDIRIQKVETGPCTSVVSLLARVHGASTIYRRTSLSRKEVYIVLTVSLGHGSWVTEGSR